jgi:hypothetical protein
VPDKTSRLEALLPEVYAARFAEGVLHRLLDAFGAELTQADAAVKALLPSHWLDYARGDALDALAATFGQARWVLGGVPEGDASLRQRLHSLVARYTGGGTVESVKASVRSALGLPYDLADLAAVADPGLVAAVAALVDLTEFAPQPAVVGLSGTTIRRDGDRNRLDVVLDLPSVQQDRPVVEITGTSGVARNISVEVEGTGQGVQAGPELAVHPGETLILETVLGAFSARVTGPGGQRTVGYLFSALDGGPAQVPFVAVGTSTWLFRAGSGFTDPAADAVVPPGGPHLPPGGPGLPGGPGGGTFPPQRPAGPIAGLRQPQFSAFDEDTFDLPVFGARISWTVFTPLTFDVTVPYFLAEAVQRLRDQYRFSGPVFTNQGLPREQIQGVVDASRAAGVRGRLRFSVPLPLEGPDRHDADERLSLTGGWRAAEDQDMTETLSAGSVNAMSQVHDQDERLWLGGVFDTATFDGGWGFLA